MSGTNAAAVARKPVASEGLLKPGPDKNLELVKAMGGESYDPMPTEQHTCFIDPEFTLTPRGHRMLALLRYYTIRGKGPKSGRTPYAHDGRRTLHLKHFAAELDFDMPAAIKVWRELVEAGLARTDEKERLWLCGKVQRKATPPGNSEEPSEAQSLTADQNWEKFCTDNFPSYLAKQFQRLSESERPRVHTEVEAWDKYEKRAAAEAMDAARKQVRTLRDRHFSEGYGIKVRRFERKADPKAPPRPKPIVQLSLLALPELPNSKLSVQNFAGLSVPGENPTLYNVQNGGVQTTPNKEVRVVKESDIYSSSSFFPVVRAELKKHGAVDDDVLSQLVNACLEKAPDCTAEEIVHFIHVKAALIERGTRNPIGFLRTAVPKCFAPEPLREYRESNAARTMPENNDAAWGTDLTREELERELAAEDDPRFREYIEQRLRELDEREGAQKAGHA